MDFTSLTLADVSRSYGRRWALNRVSLRCEAGEIVALLGPNGAGKSTLLSVAAALLTPSAGRVRYGEHDAHATPALRQRIGLVGHDLYLYPELTAAENLTVLRPAAPRPGRRAASRRGARARAPDRRGVTMPCRVSRAACASG